MTKQAIASIALSDVQVRDLEGLLEAFGSQFSLEDIASAYSQAKHDLNVAGDILVSTNGTIVTSAMDASKGKLEGADTTPLQLASDSVLHNSYPDRKNIRVPKSKNHPLSMGTVSGVIGKEYMKTKPLTNNSCEPTKPLKLDSKELPVSEIWCDEVPMNVIEKKGSMAADVEEFLFKMLGDGFQLDMTMIEDVLSSCGYDMQKSMEKLIELSASTLEKCDDIVNVAAETSTENCPGQEPRFQQQMIRPDSVQSDGARYMTRNLRELPKRDKDIYDLQKEVLESLFVVPERLVETPKITRIVRPVRTSKAFGKAIVELHKDTTKEHTAAEPKEDNRHDEEENENSYEVLREAVKEYWITTREYYKAAVAVFVKGDHARANKLLEQGHFFSQKVREADRKSAEQLVVETRNDEVLTLDWHAVEPKEAVRLLRVHLTSLSGIPTIKYFKILVGTNDEDTTKKARIRRITRQLKKESIEWTEDRNGKAILIQVDAIDPKRLSFAKKQ